MERLYYANDSVLTGTAIARALLAYAEALAKQATAATVTFPVRQDNGTVRDATILLGPSSQIVSETEETTGEELTDEALLDRLQEATDMLVPQTVTVQDQTAELSTAGSNFEDEY